MLDLNQEEIDRLAAEAEKITRLLRGRKRSNRSLGISLPSKRRKRPRRYDLLCQRCRLYFSTKDIKRQTCRKCEPEVAVTQPIVTRYGIPLLAERPAEWWAVYALLDPRSKAVRYVGFSRRPADRMNEHCRGRHHSTRAWIRELKYLGIVPVMEILETGEGLAAGFDREAAWIRHFNDLLNVARNNVRNM